MQKLDWIVLFSFFGGMLLIGCWSYFFKNKDTEDYYVASGEVPWWIVGISHHISGYSGAVFVAYAGLAYTYGFSIYVWWAFSIGVALICCAKIFPVYWVRARKKLNVQSPLEFLSMRYDIATQQIIAWIGVLLKVFDIGGKWAAIAILLHIITGASMETGILFAGGISLLYVTFGGLWAVMATDFIQFIVQIAAGIAMFIIVILRLGGTDSIFDMWSKLPADHSHLFNDPYTVGFAVAFLMINTLSFNGGSWGLATRYISAPSEEQSSKAAYLSGFLYLIWPLILFFPMWAAPIILPGLKNATQSYGLLIIELLPAGLVGLVTASLFAATMSTVASDINTLSAVITRDILPVLSKKFERGKSSLFLARLTTFIYTLFTIIIAFQYQRFGGVIGLIISWYGALLGPISVPLLFGFLPIFKTCNSKAAITSILGGLVVFILTKFIPLGSLALDVSMPVIFSIIIYVTVGFFERNKELPAHVEQVLTVLNTQ